MATKYSVQDRPCEKTGTPVPTLVKAVDGKPDEELGTMLEFENLFDACHSRWGNNWDSEKLIVAVNESEID